MADSSKKKRARMDDATAKDVQYYGNFLMEKDPFKHRAPREEDRSFRALFGSSPSNVLILWQLLISNDLLPEGGTLTHVLWTLMYTKQYGKWSTMKILTDTDPKTLRKWIGLFYDAIELLEPEVVSHMATVRIFLHEISFFFRLLCRSVGRIGLRMILTMIVLCLLIRLTFKSPSTVVNSILISSNLVQHFDMRLLFVLELENLFGSMVHTNLVFGMTSKFFGMHY